MSTPTPPRLCFIHPRCSKRGESLMCVIGETLTCTIGESLTPLEVLSKTIGECFSIPQDPYGTPIEVGQDWRFFGHFSYVFFPSTAFFQTLFHGVGMERKR